MKTFLSSLLLAGVVGCSPCHSGHYEVDYHEAYDEWEENCWDAGETEICIPYVDHHPARCSSSFRCDWTCDTLDKGRSEAHPKHGTLRLVDDVVDPRCQWNGANAWTK